MCRRMSSFSHEGAILSKNHYTPSYVWGIVKASLDCLIFAFGIEGAVYIEALIITYPFLTLETQFRNRSVITNTKVAFSCSPFDFASKIRVQISHQEVFASCGASAAFASTFSTKAAVPYAQTCVNPAKSATSKRIAIIALPCRFWHSSTTRETASLRAEYI